MVLISNPAAFWGGHSKNLALPFPRLRSSLTRPKSALAEPFFGQFLIMTPKLKHALKFVKDA